MDKKLAQEIKQVKERLKRIKDYVSSWYHSEMMKQLIREHVKPIKPPLKKTNITLKNPNFRIAARLWDYIRVYDTEPKENAKENKVLEDSIDLLKGFFRAKTVSLDEVIEQADISDDDNKEVLEAVLALPEKYRKVIYLHYYEGYSAPEIGKILNKNVNTIYTYLNRGKQLLKTTLGGDDYAE